MFKKWEKISASDGFDMLLGLMGLVGIIVITGGVICRFVLKVSFAWTDELLRTVFVWAYFLGAAKCFSEGGIMRLELLEEALKRHGHNVAKGVIAIVCELLNIAFFGVCSYFVFVTCQNYFVRGVTTSTSDTPAWVLPLSYGVCCAIIVAFSVRNTVRQVRLFRSGASVPPPEEASAEDSN